MSGHVVIPAFAEDGHGGGAGLKEGPAAGILLRGHAAAARAAEGGQAGRLQLQVLQAAEELHVLGIRARIPGLDIGDAQVIEDTDDFSFVLDGVRNPFGLSSVPQRRIKDRDMLVHDGTSPGSDPARILLTALR